MLSVLGRFGFLAYLVVNLIYWQSAGVAVGLSVPTM
jgi:hypothetical protein